MVKITSVRFKQNSGNEEKLGCRRSVRRVVTYRSPEARCAATLTQRVSCTVSIRLHVVFTVP